MAVIRVFGVGFVAGDCTGIEHGGICDAPLVAGEPEGSCGNLPGPVRTPWGLGIHELEDAVEVGLDVFPGRDAIGDFVVGLEQMEGSVGVVLGCFLLD